MWSRDLVKMQGFELATIFVAPSDFQNFWETDPRKLVGVLGALIEVVTGPCKNAVNRACGHLGGPLGFSKLFPGASSGTPGASREGKKFRLGSFEPAVGRRTDRLLFYRVGGRPGPSHPVKQESIWPAHGAL